MILYHYLDEEESEKCNLLKICVVKIFARSRKQNGFLSNVIYGSWNNVLWVVTPMHSNKSQLSPHEKVDGTFVQL